MASNMKIPIRDGGDSTTVGVNTFNDSVDLALFSKLDEMHTAVVALEIHNGETRLLLYADPQTGEALEDPIIIPLDKYWAGVHEQGN